MTYTIEKKGQSIEFDSAFEHTEDAVKYAKEFLSYSNFAMSLISHRNLSEKQEAWIHYIATEKLNEALFPQEKEDGPYVNLVKKMYEGVKSKNRKFNLHLPGNISISTVTKGININHLYVFDSGHYCGKITPEGVFRGEASEDVLNLLEDANENLLKLAQMYGHETGQCSVCNRELSDKKSIQLGIGPICLKRLQ